MSSSPCLQQISFPVTKDLPLTRCRVWSSTWSHRKFVLPSLWVQACTTLRCIPLDHQYSQRGGTANSNELSTRTAKTRMKGAIKCIHNRASPNQRTSQRLKSQSFQTACVYPFKNCQQKNQTLRFFQEWWNAVTLFLKSIVLKRKILSSTAWKKLIEQPTGTKPQLLKSVHSQWEKANSARTLRKRSQYTQYEFLVPFHITRTSSNRLRARPRLVVTSNHCCRLCTKFQSVLDELIPLFSVGLSKPLAFTTKHSVKRRKVGGTYQWPLSYRSIDPCSGLKWKGLGAWLKFFLFAGLTEA